MKTVTDIVIVIPVGPNCKIEFIIDTIYSINYYVHSTYKILISDDSHNSVLADNIKTNFPEVVLLKTKQTYGKGLGLYVSLSNAYRYALENFDFKALLRLDTDALITGHNPELPALALFKNNPNIGLAGRIIKGKISSDDFGSEINNTRQRAKLIQLGKLFTRYYLERPIINWKIRKLLFKALHNDYEMGQMVFGGAYFFSRIGLEKLRDNGLLPLESVRKSEIEEDLFFSLLICSVGLTLGDLSSGDLPFGCTWRGLPASPETLYNAGKKIIHSTRFWQDLKEEDIRNYFKSKRLSTV